MTREHYIILLPPAFLVITTIVVIIVQIVPNPIFLAHGIWERAANVLGTPLTSFISIAPHQAAAAFGAPLAALMAFFSAFLNSIKRDHARMLMTATAIASCLYAGYALICFLSRHSSILWSDRAQSFSVLTEPFVNRNHAATFYGIASVLWFAFALAELRKPLRDTSVSTLDAMRAVVEESPMRLFGFLGAFMICITATFLTQSRAGIILTLAALLICFGIFAFRYFARHPKSWLVFAVTVLVFGLFVEIWGGAVAYRIGMIGLKDLGRWETYSSTLRLIRDYPWMGTGFGSFETALPPYRSSDHATMIVWDHAHNTLLELTAELGVVLAVITLFTVTFLTIMLLRGALERRRDAVIPLATFAAALLALTHSLIDFSLQIPALAITFAALVGCGLARSLRSSNVTSRDDCDLTSG